MSKATRRGTLGFHPKLMMPAVPGILTIVGLLAAFYALRRAVRTRHQTSPHGLDFGEDRSTN
jgi:hypothetical protein